MNFKKVIIFSLLFCFTNLAIAQVSFTEPSNKWYVVKSFPNGNIQNPNFLATTTTLYGNNGDTIINSEIWTIITSTTDSILPINPDSVLGFTKTNQNYVFFTEKGSNNIDTIYNFSLNVGDSVLYNFPVPTYLHVDSVDSVLISGTFHKKIFFETVIFPLCCVVKEVWIEGIGSLHGPLFPFYPKMLEIESYNEGNDLSCFKQNGLSVWNHPNYNNCYINITLDVEFNNSEKSAISYPNPTKGLINIDLTNIYNTVNIQVVNILEKVVIEKRFYNTSKISLDLNYQKRGAYFIYINADSIPITLRIIKN